MSLDLLRNRMAWPEADDVTSPSGAGPRVLVDLVREKIARSLRRSIGDAPPLRVGILTKNPNSNGSEAPIAVVCEFGRVVTSATLALAHRLAWSFARSPLLVTIEPQQVRTWTCCEPPADQSRLFELPAEIDEARLDLTRQLTPSEQAAHALHWVRLASGDFYRQFPDRFRRDGRADRALLEELTAVRKRLKLQKLPGGKQLSEDTIHDLLARVVFVKFLFDRKDADGRPAINATLLSRLCDEGILSQQHESLETILGDYDETYRFFRWLNDKFNGDLFPGKGETESEREAEWREEMNSVKPKHLQTLADFVGGKLRGRQRILWPQYSFDVVPLEFISSIYEEFVTAKGAHYTPGYLVDFMLDEVLPWDGETWDLKILDPACGSGIFLVKAYQRLIQRWKNAHPDKQPSTGLLKRLLQRNLLGVDIDPHAVRVASFSLYLTMCDEIDPKRYLRNTKFPRLRGKQLRHADFFEEDTRGFSTERDGPTFDLVVGNAPWGEKTETKPARAWAEHKSRQWLIPNKSVGTLFLPKAASLTKPDGRVSMIQPASSLLFNRSGPANRFREKLFTQVKVTEVVNLSTLRFELFENATSPPCVVTFCPTQPDGDPILYLSPKQVKPTGGTEVGESSYSIVIEPNDIARIWPNQAAEDPMVWTTLAWGGRRDLELVRKLNARRSLKELDDKGQIDRRKGIVRGNKLKPQPRILGRRILESPTFPVDAFLTLDARSLPKNQDYRTESASSTKMEPFDLPQLILKKSWQADTGRLKAVVTRSTESTGGIVCTQSYVSVHSDDHESWLDAACLSYNSILSVYYLLLTSGRLASYRPEALVEEILSVPIPEPHRELLRGVENLADVDTRIRDLLAFKPAEWLLVEDLNRFTLPDFKGDENSPGRQATERKPGAKRVTTTEPIMGPYCQYFLRVLKAGFGQDKKVSATIYQDRASERLPVRMVAVHLDWDRDQTITVESMESGELCCLLVELDKKLLQAGDPSRGGIFFQRIARVYDEFRHSGRRIPTVYIIKPDRIRYWTRSAALRDADEVAADITVWQTTKAASKRGPKRA